VVENDASVVVIEGLNALGDMFIRHNALNMMKNLNNSRQIIQNIEHGFQLIAQMIDSRVNRIIFIEKQCLFSFDLDSQYSFNSFNEYD
jgi:hypothetical protein